MITENTKKDIQGLLNKFCTSYDSQAKAVAALKDVSEATIINIRKGNWESISDAKWLGVGRQVGYSNKGVWEIVETDYFNFVTNKLTDAKTYGTTMAICSPAGSGKTRTTEKFKENNKNVYHIICSEHMNRRYFLHTIQKAIGLPSSGSVHAMLDDIIDALRGQPNPIIILDEVDKLNDNVLYFFISLYNHLNGKCGIVLFATDHFNKRVLDGVRKNKKGYNEIFSRLNRKFISAAGVSEEEVTAICKRNGLFNPETIAYLYNTICGDLRVLSDLVPKAIEKEAKNKAA